MASLLQEAGELDGSLFFLLLFIEKIRGSSGKNCIFKYDYFVFILITSFFTIKNYFV